MDASSDHFETFWAAYPKKRAKHDARKAWNALKPSPTLQQVILEAVGRRRQSYEWRKDQGQYIPYAATFLRGRRWEDEDATPVSRTWTCPHSPRCDGRWACDTLQKLGR